LTPPPHANLPPQQQHQAPPPPAQPQQPSYLDAITELQQVNQAVNCLNPSSLKALQVYLQMSCAFVINALGNHQKAQFCLMTKGYKQAELRKHHITSKHVFPLRWVVQFSRSINTNILAAVKISSSLLMGFECSWQAGCNMHP